MENISNLFKKKLLPLISFLVIPSVFSLAFFLNPQAVHAATLLFRGDFETGDISGWKCSGNCPTVVTSPTRAGNYSLRTFLDAKTSRVNYRTELSLLAVREFKFGQEYWLGVSFYLPPDWSDDYSGPGTYDQGMLWQFHDRGFNDPSWRSGLPLVLRHNDGKFKIERRGHPSGKTFYEAPYEKGRWIDWVINVRWSKSSDGFINIWKDGQQIVSDRGANYYPEHGDPPYFKMGLYQWGWDEGVPLGITQRTVYHDEVRVAQGSNGYSLVAPSGSPPIGGPPPPPPEAPQPALAQSCSISQLWGKAGELWDPRGRLPDYSYAGYHAGERLIPSIPVTANVRDFGATGNGIKDDTLAFKSAIASVSSGAILVPAGKYKLSDVIHIRKSNVVLRGEGSGTDGTILKFTKSLTDIYGSGTWHFGNGGLIWLGRTSRLGGTRSVGRKIATVTAQAIRGDTILSLSSTSSIKPGDYVVLGMDDPDGSLGRHFHNELLDPGQCTWQPLNFNWPVKVQSVSPSTITLAQPLRFDVQAKWNPTIYKYTPIEEVGVEHLSIEFPIVSYPGHLMERGFNGVYFEGTLNSWARNITVVNADNGVTLDQEAKQNTISGLTLKKRQNGSFTSGHHGVSFGVNAHDNLLTNFNLDRNIHDITVNHQASGNVIRRGTGVNINFDHHRNQPFENLFSDIDLGTGSRIYTSGGAGCAGPQSGARETFWNIRARNWVNPPAPDPNNFPQANVIPADQNQFSENGEWLENLGNLCVRDLYTSQLQKRLGGSPPPPGPPPPGPPGPPGPPPPGAQPPGPRPPGALPQQPAGGILSDYFRPSTCAECPPGNELFCAKYPAIQTALGCIPTHPVAFISRFMGILLGVGGGIAFLLMGFAAACILTSRGEQERVQHCKRVFISAFVGLLFMIFSTFLLEVIGVDILGLF